MVNLGYGASSAGVLLLTFCLLGNTLLTDFISASWAASERAPRHLDLSGDPVDLRVMLPKPRMS